LLTSLSSNLLEVNKLIIIKRAKTLLKVKLQLKTSESEEALLFLLTNHITIYTWNPIFEQVSKVKI